MSPRKSSSEPAVTHDKLVRLAKQGMGHSAAAQELGVSVGQISSMAWSNALVSAGRYDKAPSTPASVKKLYDVEGNRWELIAARTGQSVARVKELYGGDEAVAKANLNKRSGNGGKTAGKSATAKKGTGKTAAASASPRRARTRAERMAARSNNPS